MADGLIDKISRLIALTRRLEQEREQWQQRAESLQDENQAMRQAIDESHEQIEALIRRVEHYQNHNAEQSNGGNL
ncbi:MAG TPA: hypothetical protein ENM98_00240 [Halothiobacillaceae bacterium]|nr:hypothetical protein [Halothiobacillaceae bacterium]